MTRTVLIAAMPAELKPLVRGWRHERQNSVDLWRWRFDEGEWIAACAGAGVDQAARAFAEVEKGGALDEVISVGWAGALREDLAPGQAYRVSGVIDARTGERFRAQDAGDSCNETPRSQNREPEHPDLWLVTSSRVADAQEKLRLEAAYSAALVDMEAAGVARLAAMRGIPFYCVKGISDGKSDQLPDFNRFISPSDQFQLTRFVFFAILSPWYWRPLIRMGENSKRAALSMAKSLLDLLDEQGTIRKRNG
ncbi:MAG: nucleoside phosphorylase [Terracidiphilus sp.]|nr:nucleoside phosphorylase [Terracidiphilus sp.]